MCLKKKFRLKILKKILQRTCKIIYICVGKSFCYANLYMTSIISVLCYAYTNMTFKILPSAKQNSIWLNKKLYDG